MSEERRAAPAPNGLEAGAAEAADLDADGLSARPGARDSSPAARRRGRMTLRIPDDEVVRPTTESAPPPPVRALSRPAPRNSELPPGAVMPMRIISIESDLPPAPAEFDPVPIPIDEATVGSPDLATTGEWTAATLAIEDGDDVEVVSHIQIDGAINESEPPGPPTPRRQPTAPVLPSAPSTPRVVVAAGRKSSKRLLRSPRRPSKLSPSSLTPRARTSTSISEDTGETLAAAAEETSEDLAAVAEETAEELASSARG